MRRFLRWLVGVPEPVDGDTIKSLKQELEDVRDDVEHLGRRFTKLQGQVTRAWRDELPPEEEDDEDDDDEILREINRRRA